jgi:hypothetical protein
MIRTVNHVAPTHMQPTPINTTSEFVTQQVNLWAASVRVPGAPYMVHTQSAMAIASWWQSPGTHGIGMARFASTGTITDDLIGDIDREIIGGDCETVADRLALGALRAYVRSCTITAYTVGSNTPGYLPESAHTFLSWADARTAFIDLVSEAPEALTIDADAGDCSADGPCEITTESHGTCDVDSLEECEFHSLDAEVKAFLTDDVPSHTDGLEFGITLCPDSRALGTHYFLAATECTVADVIDSLG